MADPKTFALDLSKLIEKTKGKIDLVVRKIVLDMGTRIVLRSPVGDGKYWISRPPKGYTGGRFRANWQYGEGAVPAGVVNAIDKTGQISLRSIMKIAPQAGGKVHYITNNLPYAQRIENGWSRQAPKGMVDLTLIEYRAVVRDAAAAVKAT